MRSPDTILDPSLVKTNDLIESRCPFKHAIASPPRFHKRTVASSEPVASVSQFGEKATEVICYSLPVFMFRLYRFSFLFALNSLAFSLGVFATTPSEIQAMTPLSLTPTPTPSRGLPLQPRRHRTSPPRSRRPPTAPRLTPPVAHQAGIPHATLDYWVRRQQRRDDRDPDDTQLATSCKAQPANASSAASSSPPMLASTSAAAASATCAASSSRPASTPSSPLPTGPASSGQNPTEASPRLWPKRTATPGCWHGYQEHRRLPG